jgi:catechol 2,3-dioxygenase-like lactoylglutathione lyase family enzyme
MAVVAPPRLRLDHVGFVVRDLDAAVSWYTDALGCTVQWTEAWTDVDPVRMALTDEERVHLRGAILRVGEHVFLELHEFAEPRGGDKNRRTCDLGIGHVSFYTTAIQTEYERLGKLGVHWYGEPVEITAGGLKGHWWCYGRDPFGFLIQLNWWPEPESDERAAT